MHLNGVSVNGNFTFDGTSFGSFYIANAGASGYAPNVYDSGNGGAVNTLSTSSFILTSATCATPQIDFADPLDDAVSPDPITGITADGCGDGCIVTA